MATLTRFRERSSVRGRVDREAGIISGVKILGQVSRNGRRYTPEAMREAAGLYNGKKIYVNHPRKNEMDEDRPMQDWVGNLQNVRYENGGLFGDMRLRKHSGHFEAICEAAEADEFNRSFGLSHEADGETHFDSASGDEVVSKINEVFAVAVVTDPATTAGIFESAAGSLKSSIAELREIAANCTALADRLEGVESDDEEDGDDADADEVPPPTEDLPGDPLSESWMRKPVFFSGKPNCAGRQAVTPDEIRERFARLLR